MNTLLSLVITVIAIIFYNGQAFAKSTTLEGEVVSSDQPLKSKANQSPIVRAGDIYASCQHHFDNSFNTNENISKRASCNGYFFGIGGILILLQNEKLNTKTCIPKDISAHHLAKAFLEWAKDPKNDLNISAPEATLKAVRKAYKCK